MKVIYVYLAVIFGGGFIAIIYLRAQDRGWPSTVAFFGMLVAVSLFQARRAKKKQTSDSHIAGDSEDA